MLKRNKSQSSLLHYDRNNITHVFLFLLISFLFFSPLLPFDNVNNRLPKQQYHAFAQIPDTGTTANNFLTYDNPTIGITIQYPSNFEILEFGKSVAFHTPLETGEQVFSEQVGILTGDDIPTIFSNESAGTSINSNESAGTSINDYLEEQFNNFKNTSTNFSLVEGPTDISINGNPSKRAVFTNTLSDGSKLRTMEIWTVDQSSGKLFQIEVSVDEGKYPEFPPEHIQKMIDSFEITPLRSKQNPQPLLRQELTGSLPIPIYNSELTAQKVHL